MRRPTRPVLNPVASLKPWVMLEMVGCARAPPFGDNTKRGNAMSWEALALVAVISQGSVTHQRHVHPGYAPGRGDGRLLATRAPYPSNRVDDPRRPGGNGREWIDTAEHGGTPTRWAIGWRDPGPGAYGADELDASARVRSCWG